MIDLSFTKLLLVAVIALIVLGPEKLPKAARMAGAMIRRMRVGWDSVRSEVERELEVEEIRRAAKEAVARAEAFQKSATETAQSARKSVTDAVAEVAAAARVSAEPVASATEDADEPVASVTEDADAPIAIAAEGADEPVAIAMGDAEDPDRAKGAEDGDV